MQNRYQQDKEHKIRMFLDLGHNEKKPLRPDYIPKVEEKRGLNPLLYILLGIGILLSATGVFLIAVQY